MSFTVMGNQSVFSCVAEVSVSFHQTSLVSTALLDPRILYIKVHLGLKKYRKIASVDDGATQAICVSLSDKKYNSPVSYSGYRRPHGIVEKAIPSLKSSNTPSPRSTAYTGAILPLQPHRLATRTYIWFLCTLAGLTYCRQIRHGRARR